MRICSTPPDQFHRITYFPEPEGTSTKVGPLKIIPAAVVVVVVVAAAVVVVVVVAAALIVNKEFADAPRDARIITVYVPGERDNPKLQSLELAVKTVLAMS